VLIYVNIGAKGPFSKNLIRHIKYNFSTENSYHGGGSDTQFIPGRLGEGLEKHHVTFLFGGGGDRIADFRNEKTTTPSLDLSQTHDDFFQDAAAKLRWFFVANFDSGFLAIILDKADHLAPGKAAAVLHQFCDNSNAPHKRVAIILTVSCDVPAVEERNPIFWDRLAEQCLSDAWSRNGLHRDSIAPLMARVANSVVYVQ